MLSNWFNWWQYFSTQCLESSLTSHHILFQSPYIFLFQSFYFDPQAIDYLLLYSDFRPTKWQSKHSPSTCSLLQSPYTHHHNTACDNRHLYLPVFFVCFCSSKSEADSLQVSSNLERNSQKKVLTRKRQHRDESGVYLVESGSLIHWRRFMFGSIPIVCVQLPRK